jgi:hypothetical protein
MKTPETLKQKLESHIAFLSAGRSEEEIRAAFEDIVGAACDEMTGKTADSMYFPHTYKGINARIEEEKLTKERLLEEIK